MENIDNIVEEPAPKYNYITPEAYLEAERAATEKHEYYDGEVFAMSGASRKHNFIFSNLFIDLGNKLKGKGCRPLGSDMRMHIPANTLYTYPDISVYCGNPETTDNHFDTAINPTVIIEILSASTRNYDSGQKFVLYKAIPTLKDYILVDSEKIWVQHHIRNTDNSWLQYEYNSISDSFNIASIDVTLQLQTIYEDLLF